MLEQSKQGGKGEFQVKKLNFTTKIGAVQQRKSELSLPALILETITAGEKAVGININKSLFYITGIFSALTKFITLI